MEHKHSKTALIIVYLKTGLEYCTAVVLNLFLTVRANPEVHDWDDLAPRVYKLTSNGMHHYIKYPNLSREEPTGYPVGWLVLLVSH